MTTMRERMARAMWERQRAYYGMVHLSWETQLPGDQKPWLGFVDAVLDAMREPTEEMLAAAMETPGMRAADSAMQLHQARGYGFDAAAFKDGSPLLQAWRAEIDAAKEGK